MRDSIFKQARLLMLVVLIICISVLIADAQCPMCRMSAESNLKDGGTVAAGLNKGIIFLLTVPYILISTVGYFWWKSRKRVQEYEQEQEIRSLLEPHDMVISKTEFNEKVES